MSSRVVIALVQVQHGMDVYVVHIGPPHEVVDYLYGFSGRVDVVDKVADAVDDDEADFIVNLQCGVDDIPALLWCELPEHKEIQR